MTNDTSGIKELKELSVEESFKKFSSGKNGLSGSIEDRIKEYGYNEISEKKVNPLIKFLSYFWGPIPWMIEVAAILSAVVHHWEDFWIIFLLLLLNAVVGFWQATDFCNTRFAAFDKY